MAQRIPRVYKTTATSCVLPVIMKSGSYTETPNTSVRNTPTWAVNNMAPPGCMLSVVSADKSYVTLQLYAQMGGQCDVTCSVLDGVGQTLIDKITVCLGNWNCVDQLTLTPA